MTAAFRLATVASPMALYVILASAAPTAAQTAEPGGQMKFCGDPTLVGDEPCLPPNWCEGPNGTYPARLDGICHPDAENGPPPIQNAVVAIPQFRCAEGYVPVLIGGNQPACAGDLRPPEGE